MTKYKVIYGAPGTGKTTYITTMIESINEPVLVLSFTKAAAGEIVKRCKRASASTLHSLCYQHLQINKGQVVDRVLLKDFGRRVGMDFTGGSVYEEEITIGDRILALRSLAINRCEAPESAYRSQSNLPFTFQQFEYICDSYDRWKATFGYIDFNDMLRNCLEGFSVDHRHLVIDEAQDLSKLQWLVIRAIINKSEFETVTIAGDDDQAIYVWSGADSDGMQRFESMHKAKRVVLDQSYRLPRAVHKLAQSTIRKIEDRVDKNYKSRNENGLVEYHMSTSTLPLPIKNQSMLILYRSHCLRRECEKWIQDKGIPYTVLGNFRGSYWDGIYGRVLRLLKFFRNSVHSQGYSALDGRETDELLKWLEPQFVQEYKAGVYKNIMSERWWKLVNFPINIKRYFLDVFEKGWDINDRPNVVFSTIHGAKGMEADIVILVNDGTEMVIESMANNPDDEIRTFYVGITRAKIELHVIDGNNIILNRS